VSLQLLSVLRSRRTTWKLVLGVRFLGKGEAPPQNALAQWVPGHGQCHPFALSNPSSTCEHSFDIYPVTKF